MNQARQQCQQYVNKAAEFICGMSDHLSVDDIRQLLREPKPRDAEARVDAAALSGNVAATKMACRAWWAAWKAAVTQHRKKVG